MKVKLFVDGKQIPLNEFVSKAIGRTMLGMVSSLKHIERPSKVVIELEAEEEDYHLFGSTKP
jgi:hypothetical protein